MNSDTYGVVLDFMSLQGMDYVHDLEFIEFIDKERSDFEFTQNLTAYGIKRLFSDLGDDKDAKDALCKELVTWIQARATEAE